MLFSEAEVFSLMYCGLRYRGTLCVLSYVVNKLSEGYTAYRFRAEGKDRGSCSGSMAALSFRVECKDRGSGSDSISA